MSPFKPQIRKYSQLSNVFEHPNTTSHDIHLRTTSFPNEHDPNSHLYSSHSSPPSTPPSDPFSQAMLKIQQFYKSDRQKFGGAKNEDWNKALKNFEQFGTKFRLSSEQKASCQQLILRDEAEDFFLTE